MKKHEQYYTYGVLLWLGALTISILGFISDIFNIIALLIYNISGYLLIQAYLKSNKL